jgi:uncharacterized membrane protein
MQFWIIGYLPNFFIHISTSLIVLLIGIFQFIPSFIQKYPKAHRNIGKMYIILILFFAAPSGFIIGLFANGNLIVLLIGIFQFIPSFIQKYPKAHRNIGKMYIILILFFAAPSGFIIGLFANGGLSCKVGFCLQSIAWFLITFFAYIEIRRKNIENHINWMVRSFAITLAAMSLRTESYFMHYFLHTKPIETYLTVTWLSWVGNLMIAEIIIQFKIPYKILFLQIFKTLKK